MKNQNCEDGACMKMWFQAKNGAFASNFIPQNFRIQEALRIYKRLILVSGDSHVWRSCIPKAREQIRSDCTKVSSSQGKLLINYESKENGPLPLPNLKYLAAYNLTELF